MKLTTPSQKPKHTKVFKTKPANLQTKKRYQWWLTSDKNLKGNQLVDTVAFLKENQTYKQRQAGIFARLYGNMSLFSFIGSTVTRMDNNTGLPTDRPTFNVIQSATDTLISRISQNRPAPVFLTDNGDYKERRLAEQLNHFIQGEFYQTKAYEKAALMLRDAMVWGTGILKVYETEDHKVGLERKMWTECFVDPNESMSSDPRQFYEVKMVDREVLISLYPKYEKILTVAENAYPDNSSESGKTISDLVMIVEGWHLPSGKEAKDGRHTIACSSGVLLDEDYSKQTFPFVFLHYSNRLAGFWSQGLAEQLMGTQLEINSLLYTTSRALKLMGVPRILQEASSKVMSTAHNNDLGVIVKYQGIKPEYVVNASNAPELYERIQQMIDYAYQQCGVSAMQASSNKPAGLNSGAAQRVYDDIATDRFASLSRKYDNLFIDLAYLITDQAMDICKETGSYQTVYPNKDGTKVIDLPEMDMLKDPFVIQCFNTSALPKDPAGRMQTITDWIQAGAITLKQGMRLMDFPDLNQYEKLANASEERIYQILDKIVKDGEFTPPDPFLDLDLATQLTTQYYNLYSPAKLEEDKLELIRTFFLQVQTIKQAAIPPQMPQAQQPGNPQNAAAMAPAAAAEALPSSPLIPNGNPSGAQ